MIGNMKRVYLDHAAATPIDEFVKNKMLEVMNLASNPSGIYASALEVRNEISSSRKGIANILNCHNDELIFTGSGTESNNLAILGYIKNFALERGRMQKNNVIPKVLTTKLEHPSVLEPLRHMAEMGMIEIIFLENDEFGVVSSNYLKKLLEESGVTNSLNIILVSTMHATNFFNRHYSSKFIACIHCTNQNNIFRE
jgi:cysteine desulfurase